IRRMMLYVWSADDGVIVLCVFFFQAEDGIRGRNVTGVQTCALPISTRSRPTTRPPMRPRTTPPPTSPTATTPRTTPTTRTTTARSEERRVGKSVDLGGRRLNKNTTGGHLENKELKRETYELR